jgi:hypothetical protein
MDLRLYNKGFRGGRRLRVTNHMVMPFNKNKQRESLGKINRGFSSRDSLYAKVNM